MRAKYLIAIPAILFLFAGLVSLEAAWRPKNKPFIFNRLDKAFAFVSVDGVLLCTPDFKKPKFIKLPDKVTAENSIVDKTFHSEKFGLFLFRGSPKGLWTCHLGPGGWKVQKNKEVQPQTITVMANGQITASRYVQKDGQRLQDIWKGQIPEKGNIKWSPVEHKTMPGNQIVPPTKCLTFQEWRKIYWAPAKGIGRNQEKPEKPPKNIYSGEVQDTVVIEQRMLEPTKFRVSVQSGKRSKLSKEFEFSPKKVGERFWQVIGIWLDQKKQTFQVIFNVPSPHPDKPGVQYNKFYRTTDSGATWQPLFDNLWQGRPFRLLVEPK